MGFISLVNEIQFMLISGHHISNRSMFCLKILLELEFKIEVTLKIQGCQKAPPYSGSTSSSLYF